MISTSIIAVVFAGAVAAFTPAGFEPAAAGNLTVAFGSVLAVNGANIPKADTASTPIVGTTTRLVGTYAIMMVDPDIPGKAGGPTTELLHWMQTGLVSANTTTNVGGVAVYELINPSNIPAAAAYIQPSPPDVAPTTHRYTQMLMDISGNTTAAATLAKFAASRGNFSAVNVVKSAGLSVLAGNSFNVSAVATNSTAASNGTAPAAPAVAPAAATMAPINSATLTTAAIANPTAAAAVAETAAAANASATTTETAAGAQSTGGAVSGKISGGGAFVAALAAAVALL